MEELTQANTLALDEDFINDNNNVKGWAILKSLNPSYPDVSLVHNETTFGRLKESTVHYNDKGVSGAHCKITRESNDDDGVVIAFIYDTSTNGTFIDNIKVGKGGRCLLASGQEIGLTPQKQSGSDKIAYIYQTIEKERDDDGGPQNKYLIGEVLGQGNFATVKLAVERKTGLKYAVKIIDKKKYFMNSGSRKDSLMDEVNILRGLSHPNIIQIIEVFESDKVLSLILELVECGELLNDILVNQFYTEDKAKKLFRQIVDGVSYLHNRGIAHRDLKPENILLKHKNFDQNDAIKLTDFGLSRTISDGSFMKTMCGTPQYLAPEILISTAGQNGYGLEVDCWSMGAILYIMLSGNVPFEETKEYSIFEQIRNAKFGFPDEYWSEVSEEAKDLIKRLLCVDPYKRYTCNQIVDHPWYNSNVKLKTLLEKDELLKQQQTSNSNNNNGSPSMLGKRKSGDPINNSRNNSNNSLSSSTTSTTIEDDGDSNNIISHKKSKSDPTNSLFSGKNNNNNNDDEDSDTDDETISLPVITKNSKSMSNLQNHLNNNKINSDDDSDTNNSSNDNNKNNNTFKQPPKSPPQSPPQTLLQQQQQKILQQQAQLQLQYQQQLAQQQQKANNNNFPVPYPKSPVKSSPNSSPLISGMNNSNNNNNHHNQSGGNSNNGGGSNIAKSDKPLCIYDPKCYRKNPQHLKDYYHTVSSGGNLNNNKKT